IASQQEATDVAITVIDETCKVLSCDRTSFFFVDGNFLDLVIAKGANNIRMPKSTGFAGDCATTGNIVNIPNAYKGDHVYIRNSKNFLKSPLFKNQIKKKEDHQFLQKKKIFFFFWIDAINKKDDTPFDAIDEQLLQSIALQVGVALRFAQKQEEARRAIDQKNALMHSPTVASILFNLNKAAHELIDSDRCTVYIVDQQAHSMHIASADASIDIVLPLNKGIAGYVASTGKTLNIEDAYLDDRFDQTWDKKTGYRTKSMLVVAVWPETREEEKERKKAHCRRPSFVPFFCVFSQALAYIYTSHRYFIYYFFSKSAIYL
ncbi:GAF domain containing protein, partial [Reticulomyxa filosa]